MCFYRRLQRDAYVEYEHGQSEANMMIEMTKRVATCQSSNAMFYGPQAAM